MSSRAAGSPLLAPAVDPMLDLRSALAAPGSFLAHDPHLSPAGHAIVAEAVSAWLPGLR